MTSPGRANRVEWLDAPTHVGDDTLVVVIEALIPMFLWLAVPVVRAVEHKLSAIERFLIEAALALGEVSARDVAEVTALPDEATHRIAGHLCTTGVLEARPEHYLPIQDAARAALDREVIIEHRSDQLSFLVLPETDDILAFEHRQGRPQPPKLNPPTNVGVAPLPEGMRGLTRGTLLRHRVQARQVAGLPDDIVDIADPPDDPLLDDTCPTYRCRGRLRQRPGRVTARVDVYGDGNDRHEPIPLSGAEGLIYYWLAQADLPATPEVASLAWTATAGDAPTVDQASPPDLVRTGSTRWTFRLDEAAAHDAVGRGRRLAQPGGVRITDPDGTTKTEVTVDFEPVDQPAAAVFVVEEAVQDLLDIVAPTSADVSAAIVKACASHGLPAEAVAEDDVRDRLWQHGHYLLIYRLRDAEDFSYA